MAWGILSKEWEVVLQPPSQTKRDVWRPSQLRLLVAVMLKVGWHNVNSRSHITIWSSRTSMRNRTRKRHEMLLRSACSTILWKPQRNAWMSTRATCSPNTHNTEKQTLQWMSIRWWSKFRSESQRIWDSIELVHKPRWPSPLILLLLFPISPLLTCSKNKGIISRTQLLQRAVDLTHRHSKEMEEAENRLPHMSKSQSSQAASRLKTENMRLS